MRVTDRLRVATFAQLDAATLYEFLRLRVDVFVVEQRCPYRELDGRDTEPTTRHVWLERDSRIVAYLRLLAEPDGCARIGRVVVDPTSRGEGLAGRLLAETLIMVRGRDCVLDAQTPLAAFYARYGFKTDGPEFLEDGIAHLPMRRPH